MLLKLQMVKCFIRVQSVAKKTIAPNARRPLTERELSQLAAFRQT
jgi:hypothetical protein